MHTEPELLPGVIEKFKEWEVKGNKNCSITGSVKVLEVTENALRNAGIP